MHTHPLLGLVERIHQEHADAAGMLSQQACQSAADDLGPLGPLLHAFLRRRALEMDRPVRVEDIVSSVSEWQRTKQKRR